MPVTEFAAICLNGHVYTPFAEGVKDIDPFCQVCGALVITECPHCHEKIKRRNYEGMAVVRPFPVPAYCFSCSHAYPWTSVALESAAAIIADDSSIDPDNRQALTDTLPDLMTDTPKTQLAISRLKKALLSCGKFTAEGLRQFVIDFGCEVAKKQLGF